MADEFDHPLEWNSHTNGFARDEAAFFAGWNAARHKFVASLRQHFSESHVRECENVFSSLTFIFLRHKCIPAVRSIDTKELPLLHAQPWFCRVLHSLSLPAANAALQFREEVAGEMRQVLQKALLELTKVSDIWTCKKSQSDRDTVIATLERLKDMSICNIDGSDARELQRCSAAALGQVAEQVQKRCSDYATSQGLIPYINRAFDEFCGVWVDPDVSASVFRVFRSCSQESCSPALMRVVCADDMFTLSLHCVKQPTSASSVAVSVAGLLEADDSGLLCPSFPIHRSRLALLRSTFTLQYEITSFYEHVMACLLRYKAVFHPNGGNWQAAQPHGIFELWANRYFCVVLPSPTTCTNRASNRLGATIECFASPMNRNVTYPRYFSAFGDVDSPFGSSGSFFDNPPDSGVCFASPPFDEDFLSAATASIADVVRRASGKVAYIVSLPDWKRDKACHSCIVAHCDRMGLPFGRGGTCDFMVFSKGQITMNSAVAADRVGLQQSYTFGIRFYALGFNALRPELRVNYELLQRDMRQVFESGK